MIREKNNWQNKELTTKKKFEIGTKCFTKSPGKSADFLMLKNSVHADKRCLTLT